MRNVHVKHSRIEDLEFDSTAPILETTTQKYMIHFCYNMTTESHHQHNSPFQESRQTEFNTLVGRGVFFITPRSVVS